MRIAFDAHTIGGRYGGNETYTLELWRELAPLCQEQGVSLTPLILNQQAGRLLTATAPASVPPLRVPANPLIRIPVALPLLLAAHRCDILHVQYIQPPLAPCRVVNTVHDISFEHFPHFFPRHQRLYLRALVPPSVRRADAVITVSDYSKRDIVERYRIPAAKVFVVHNAPAPHFRVLTDKAQLTAARRRRNLPERFVLFVSNLHPRKNLAGLLRAMHQLPNRHRDVALVVVGRELNLPPATRHLLVELGLGGRVLFTGYLTTEELVCLYNLAQLFVYPSFFEGFGLPPLEAMACSTPVVTSNTSCLPEVVGDAALTADPNNPEAMAECICRLLDDQELAADLRQRGLRRAAMFSWQRAARQTFNVYAALTGFPMLNEGCNLAAPTRAGATP